MVPAFGMIELSRFDHIRRRNHVRPHRNIRRECRARRAQGARQKNSRGHHQRASRGGGRRPRQGRPLRADGRQGGVPRRPLRAGPHHHVRPGHAQDAEAQGREVRNGGHRALQEARDLRRGGHDRDVPGRRLHQEDRGRIRDPLGRERVGIDGLEPQREGVRGRRGMALQAAHLRLSLCLRRRDLPEAGLGRLLRERGRDGGHRRQRRRLPRGHRRRGGVHGVGRVLEGVPLVAQGPGALGRAHVHRRQGRRHDRRHRRGVPGCGLSEVHRALLPQCAFEGAEVQERPGGGDAQGHPRPRVVRCQHGEGGRRRRGPGRDETCGGIQVRPRGRCRDADLHKVSHAALEAHPHQQRHRAAQPRDQAPHAGGGHLPRREERAHAGDGQAEVRGRQRVGVEEVSGRVAAGRVIMPKRMGRSCKVRKNIDSTKTRAFSLHRSIQRTHHVYVQRLLQDRHTLCSTQRMA